MKIEHARVTKMEIKWNQNQKNNTQKNKKIKKQHKIVELERTSAETRRREKYLHGTVYSLS